MQECPPQDAESFRLLTMAEFNTLTTDEKAAYLRRAMEDLDLLARFKPQAG